MEMKSVDFGAVLGELTRPTPLADKFEIRFPQKKDHWWFSIRMHCSGYFTSKPVQVACCDKKNEYLLIASKTWRNMGRPEMYLWMVEAFGLEESAREISAALHARLDEGEATVSELTETAKPLIDWNAVEEAARKESMRLVAGSPFPSLHQQSY